MQINEASLVAPSASATIESRVRSLIFNIEHSTAGDFGGFLAALANTTVELFKQTGNGSIQILPERPLMHLLEIAAATNPGGLDVKVFGGAVGCLANLDLSDFGALELFSNEFFKLSLKGIPANVTIDVFAEDSQLDANGVHNVYNTVFCNAGTPKLIDTTNSRFLALPVDSTKRVEFHYKSGRVLQLEPKELAKRATQVNEIAAIVNGVVTPGYVNHYVENVADVVKVKVTLSSDDTVIKVDYQKI